MGLDRSEKACFEIYRNDSFEYFVCFNPDHSNRDSERERSDSILFSRGVVESPQQFQVVVRLAYELSSI